MTPEIERAFRRLGVTPDADPSQIRSAWKAMVRVYHPDQVKHDKTEANRRLAELNAAFDLISTWTPEDARAYCAARAKRRAAQNRARQAQAEQREARQRAAQKRKDEAEAREIFEEHARCRAAELDRRDAKMRAARADARGSKHRNGVTPRDKFLAALRELAPRKPSSDLGFV
ncbi:J domain-containing protein [Tateyamaria armeniaca]|uniref:J domain-containing protein n=1 Tax=Tateyamaria armeniaca TaxID=2518930 RepID=A0ABW8UUJ2_9RHOB